MALAGMAEALDDLHRATQTPVTARRPWLQIWSECYPQYEPVAVVVDGPEPQRLDGAALLARRRRGPLTELVAMGHGPSDQSRLPARDAEAAAALADGIATLLGRLPRPWRLRVAQLPVGDPVATKLVEQLSAATLVPGERSPTTEFGPERSLRSYVSKNHHQQVRRMLNRMARDGLEPVVDAHRDPDHLRDLLPEIEEVFRERDHQLGRDSKIDDPHAGPFFRRVVVDAAQRGEAELVTVHLGGELAAYVLSFLDGGAYRMWNCRFHPRFEHYGIGRVANDAALSRALADADATEFDWMKGEEAYKATFATSVVPAEHLLAWSSRTARAALDLPRRAKATVKPWVQRSERLTKLVARVRRR